MRAKEFVVKKRDPNWRDMEALRKSGAAGAHRDKKKEQKQGYEKHKNKGVEEGEINDRNRSFNNGTVKKYEPYKKQPMVRIRFNKDGTHTDLNTGKVYAPDGTVVRIEDIDEGYGTKEFEVDGYTYMTDLDREEDNQKIWHTLVTPDGKEITIDWSPYSYMSKNDVDLYIKLGMPKRQSAGPLNHDDLVKLAQAKGIANLDPKLANAESMEERYRDPEDWDEGNTEPPNNFAIYINGKKWKVFQGKGQYADDAREKAHFQQLKAWAHKKSMDTGKKWEVYLTGESPTA